LFGTGSSHLARYATRFDAVEINSSFYRSHQHKTYVRWAATVPSDFRFSVKMPRAITHAARLGGADEAIAGFCEEVAGLGEKLGAILVQLPPSLAYEASVAEAFFATLRRSTSVPVVCEPRHPTWFRPGVDGLWQRHLISRVAADPAPCEGAGRVAGAGPSHYWRWHGSPRIYYSEYGDVALEALAGQLRMHAADGLMAWCIFDNTALGHAVTNAFRLKELCRCGGSEDR